MSQRLLFVVDSLNRFGATRQLDLLTRGLAADFDVHVAVLSCESQSLGECEQRSLHFLGTEQRSDTLRSLTRSGLRLRKLIRKLEPAIVHSWCHVAQRVALSAAGNNESIRHFVTELYIRPSTNMTLEAIDRHLGQQVQQFIVTHDEIKKSLVAVGYPQDKILIVPSAIGTPASANNDSVREVARRKLVQLGGFGDHVHIAGAVAPLVPRSRLKDLIWATDLLTCIRDDVHFFIFGQGSQRQRLEKFAFQTEAGHHVHFIDSEIHALDLIPGLDFFWHSHLNEPLPSTLCHAMQNEVPVISVYGSGTSELFTHQETGFATNFGARDEFARWSKFLLEQTEQGTQLAQQGRASLEGQFSTESMVTAYRAIYNES